MRTSSGRIKREIKLANIFESIYLTIVILNEKGIIETINEAAVSLFEIEEKDLIGKSFGSLVDTNDRNSFDHYFNLCRGTKKSEFIEKKGIHLINNDGKIIEADLEFSETIVNNERFFTGIIRDLSKRKELEKEIIKQKEIKEDINEKLEKERELGDLKTRFVAMASHEFKTPLTGVLSSLQLIKRYLKAENDTWELFINRSKIETHFDKIQESVINLNQILNDFLSIGKLEDGGIECKSVCFDVKEFLNDCCEELLLLRKKDQSIEYNHIGNELEAYLDPNILRNIVNNLLSNAIKYSEEGKRIVMSSEITQDKIVIIISDEGMGIPLNEQKNLFKRFFRATNVTNIQGTGLGLSIVRRYVDIMNGKISFESDYNKGTTFTLSFPKN